MRGVLNDLLCCPYTRGRFSLEAFEQAGDDVESGILRSEAGEFPIVAGIPVLIPGSAELLQLVRTGRTREAVLAAAFGEAPAAGAWHMVRALRRSYRFRSWSARLEGPRQQQWRQQIAERLFPADGHAPSAREMLELAYRVCQIRNPENFNYNYYRFGMARHLVALSFIRAMGRPSRPVLDIACGAGHMTWALERSVRPAPVVGIDSFFFSLYVAKTTIARDAHFVCGDICGLPFEADRFDSTICTDAFLNFTAKWSSLREMERAVGPDGNVMLVWNWNRLVELVYPGKSLTPAGYEELVRDRPHRMFRGSTVLERYLRGEGVPASDPASDEELNRASSVSLWMRKDEERFVDQGAFGDWPHAAGELHLNPLFQGPPPAAGAEYVRQLPSEYYAKENPELSDYLPDRVTLSAEQAASLTANRADGLEDLIARAAVLGFPPGYIG